MIYADPTFWDRIAEDYSKRPFPEPDATARKLAITRQKLKPTDRLLDVGCGTGTIALELAPHVAEAHGVDISSSMIAIANRKAASQAVPNATFHAQPAGDLAGFEADTFDCVCAYNILHLVEDPDLLARAMFRVLAPGGAFVVAVPCLRSSWFPPYTLIIPVMQWMGKAPAVNLLRAEEPLQILERAGFEAIERHDVGGSTMGVFLTARKPATRSLGGGAPA